MKTKHIISFVIILLSFISGCKTTEVISPVLPAEVISPDEPKAVIAPEEPTEVISPDRPEEVEIYKPTNELRGVQVNPDLWLDIDSEKMKDNIEAILTKAAGENYNLILFDIREDAEVYYSSNIEKWSKKFSSATAGFDPLEFAIETAHNHGLKILAGIDLLGLGDVDAEVEKLKSNSGFLLNPADPAGKSYLKKIVIELTENFDLDGFSFDLSGFKSEYMFSDSYSLRSFHQDSLQNPNSTEEWANERLTDLVEDIAVEVMLTKPYLIHSASLTTDQSESAINWLKNGIVDFIQFNLKVDDSSSIDSFKDLWDAKFDGTELSEKVFPNLMVSSQKMQDSGFNEWIEIFRKSGGRGVLTSNNYFHAYTDKLDFPKDIKSITPEQVFGLNLSDFFEDNPAGQSIIYCNRVHKTDQNGNIGIIGPVQDSLLLKILGKSIELSTDTWSIPYYYTVKPDNIVERSSPWVEFRRMPIKFTDKQDYHVLYKTDFPAKAQINGEPVKVYKTGIFFNKISLKEGANRVRASVVTSDSKSVFYEREFIYEEVDKTKEAFPLWIDQKSIEPSVDLELLPEDDVLVQFKGSLAQKGIIVIQPGNLILECGREDFADYSLYQAELPLRVLRTENEYKIVVKLIAPDTTNENSIFELPLNSSIKVFELDQFPLLEVIEADSRLTYNTGPTRLGGPIRSELQAGVILKANGKIGDNFRIRLNKVEEGIINQNDVQVLPDEQVQTPYFITNMSCGPSRGGDIVSIPYLKSIPYMVYPDPDQKRIVITLYGAKTSSTWITHRKGRKIIDNLTWRQTTPETYEVYVNLNSSKIWGYSIKKVGKSLRLYIKYPPRYNVKNTKPLSGLKVAIEAGHGGQSTGAIGLSGLVEKDINLDLALKFGEICKSMGAEVFQVRDSDISMSLLQKRRIAIASGADLLVSIHANAAGVSQGYLRVPGTSTYYNNPFWAPLAENIYNRLLQLKLAEFGVIGSFNYTVIRVSQMPSILVEQAFLTHAKDEEKMADPKFREDMARKIYEGIIDYLKYMKIK